MNATTGNPSRRHRKKAERFEAIFQTSIEMFAQQGFASVSIEAITEAVDISKGTFFNYFPSKDHVLVEYQRRIYDEMHEFAEGLDETSGRASFQQYFRKLARLIEREGETS